MSEENSGFDRRSVLKALGTTAMVGAGLGAAAGSGAARVDDDEFAKAYADETRLRFAFAQHAEGVRRTLADEGFVAEDFDFWSLRFDIDEDVEGIDPTTDDRVAGVSSLLDHGEPTAFGMVSTSSDTHEISLYVQPHRDEAYALVEPKGGDERFIVKDSEVTPQGCTYKSCSNDCCSDLTSYRYQYDCGSDCRDCVVYRKWCECEDSTCY